MRLASVCRGGALQYQVRRFSIEADKLGDFISQWRSGVVPLRERLGFEIHGAWAIESTGEFIWILGYDGPDSFADADARYYASAERKQLSPDPARYITSAKEDSAIRVL